MSQRMSVKLPRTLPIVVDSDVLGSTAISVPAHQFSPRHGAEDDQLYLYIDVPEIEDEIDRRETAYLDSHEAKVNPFHIDRDELRNIAAKKIEQGDNYQTIAARIGWTRKSDAVTEGFVPDGDRVKHLLGWRPDRPNATITDQDAQDLCRGLEIDPVDIGL